jgi:hypothetical protein
MPLLLRVDAVSLELKPEIGGCIGAFRIERRGGPFDLMRPFGRSPGELSDAVYSGMFPMLPFANWRPRPSARAQSLQPQLHHRH